MNRLSFRMTNEQHKKAKVTVYDGKTKIWGLSFSCYEDEAKQAVKEAKEQFKKNNELNKQVESDLGIVFEIKHVGIKCAFRDDHISDHWIVTGKGDFKMDFHTGTGHRFCTRKNGHPLNFEAFVVAPSAMDILHCIRMDNPYNDYFEQWCSDFGYATDSRKAYDIYNQCIQQTMMFNRNYPGIDLDEYEPLQEF